MAGRLVNTAPPPELDYALIGDVDPCAGDLRHTYASLLIAQGANIVYVSRQLGHGSSDITLRCYSHLFDRAEHAARTRDALESMFGEMLSGETLADLFEIVAGRRGARRRTLSVTSVLGGGTDV